MKRVRRSTERGYFENDWLKSYHSFSFSTYYDPEYVDYHQLRVINEDYIQPNTGFGLHPHRDMEIISYIVEGSIEHADSMGNKTQIPAGDVQVMSAGRGVRHSEFNRSQKDSLKLLQIWIQPSVTGIEPSYQQQSFSREDKLNKLLPIVSPVGGEAPLTIYQDAKVFASILQPGQSLEVELDTERAAWLQVISGALEVDGVSLTSGDAMGVEQVAGFSLVAQDESEFLLFDLPPA